MEKQLQQRYHNAELFVYVHNRVTNTHFLRRLTLGNVQALHGQHPVVIGGVAEAALEHGVVCELLQHPHGLALPAGLEKRCPKQEGLSA